MAENNTGVILNISSDLSVISPDQRLYSNHDDDEINKPVKPVTYSVIKLINWSNKISSNLLTKELDACTISWRYLYFKMKNLYQN